MVEQSVERARCPCCGKPTLQRYKIDSELALSLAFIEAVGGSRQSEVNFIAAAKEKDPSRLCVKDYALLRFWDLIEPVWKSEGKRKRGFWRITDSGLSFLLGMSKVPQFVVTSRRATIGPERVRFEGPSVGIEEVLDTKVNLDELRRGWAA